MIVGISTKSVKAPTIKRNPKRDRHLEAAIEIATIHALQGIRRQIDEKLDRIWRRRQARWQENAK